MSDKTTFDKRSSRVQVLEASQALSNHEQPVTSETIARHTGLKMTTVVDCIKVLRERDEIWSPERGVYRIQAGNTSVAVTITMFPDGGAKLEKGDVVLELNHHEMRTQLAPMLAGSAMQTVAIEMSHNLLLQIEKNRKLERRIAGLEDRLAASPKQMDLLGTSPPANDPYGVGR